MATKQVAVKHPELTWDRILKMARAYDAGKSIREVARQFGYSYTGMHTILFNAGVKFRKRGGPRRVRTTKSR
jgi:hypothetical protein